MAKYKQSYVRLPTEYIGINVEVRGLLAWQLHQLPADFKWYTALARPTWCLSGIVGL